MFGLNNNMLIIVLVLAVLLLLSVLIIFKNKKTDKTKIDDNAFLDVLKIGNIKSIDFLRNKIVIKFENIENFNAEELKQLGAKGITIVGDTVKFYIYDVVEDNRLLYENLKKSIGGKL
jgi:uncharacterized protein YuzE